MRKQLFEVILINFLFNLFEIVILLDGMTMSEKSRCGSHLVIYRADEHLFSSVIENEQLKILGGGKLDNETPYETMKRELEEEIGIKFQRVLECKAVRVTKVFSRRKELLKISAELVKDGYNAKYSANLPDEVVESIIYIIKYGDLANQGMLHLFGCPEAKIKYINYEDHNALVWYHAQLFSMARCFF